MYFHQKDKEDMWSDHLKGQIICNCVEYFGEDAELTVRTLSFSFYFYVPWSFVCYYFIFFNEVSIPTFKGKHFGVRML